MNIVRIEVAQALVPLVRLAQLLEKIEHMPRPDAAAYRQLVGRVQQELQAQAAEPGLSALLVHFPAAATLYENLQYAQAGLCREPLEFSTAAEQAARALLSRMAAKR